MDKNLIEDWTKERMASASEMPASQLLQTYRESLRFKDNPISEILEAEILRRLWQISYAKV